MPMKNYLAIDTSNEYLTVIASNNGKRTVLFEENCAAQHSVRLMGAVDRVLKEAGLAPAECGFFCAVTGPGSFTGIRIGISAAKGFCAALAKPALGITTFETLAYNTEKKALAAVPAGRGFYYVCGFAEDRSVLLPPRFVGGEELAKLAGEYEVVAHAPMPVPYTRADPAAGLAAAAEAAGEERLGDIAALYVRKSQAEEERAARMERGQQ